MANFTNTKINRTYQRVVQVNSNKQLQDGLGRQLSGSMGDLEVTGILAVTGSLNISGYPNVSASIAALEHFSSSLDNTYATDAELAAVSSSLALETAQLLNFSASLNDTFATDAELAAVSSSLALETAQLLNFSASLNDTFATDLELANVSSSVSNSLTSASNRIDSLENLSSSLNTLYLTELEWTFHSASIRNDIFADSLRIAFLENLTLVTGSQQIDLSQATGVAAQALTASYAVSASHEITYELSSSYADSVAWEGVYNKPALISSSAQLASEISGSLGAISSSISSRLSTLETLSSSLDTLYLSEEEWAFHSASIRNDIAFDSGRIAALENKTLVSSSAQIASEISGSFNFVSGGLSNRVTVLENLSSSLDSLYLSEEEWTFHSASIRNDIAFDSSRIAVLENKTLVSSSAQINLSEAFNTASYAVTASYANSVDLIPGITTGLGWGRYDDGTFTTGSFFTISPAQGEVILPNSGSSIIESYLNSTVSFYDSGSAKIQVENQGDVYVTTVVFKAKASNANGSYLDLHLEGTGVTPYDRIKQTIFFPKGNDQWHDFHYMFQYYADSDFVNNGNQWKIRAYNSDIDIADIIFFIQRTQNHG